jgi:flagellar protein FliO/FliZ
MARLAGVAIAVAALPQAALAAAADPESQPIPPGSSAPGDVGDSAGGGLLRMGIGLAAVVALVLGVWWVMKRMQRRRYPELDARAASLIDVMATAPLGPGRTLHLVRLGDEIVMVGATDHSITPVASLTPEQAARLSLSLGAPDARGAHDPAAAARPGVGTRAPAYTGGPSRVERLRAMTARR